MQGKAMKKQLKFAAYFFLLTVLVGGLSVDACLNVHDPCDPNSPDYCCDGLVCVQVSPGLYQCEPEKCEDHKYHWCKANVYECCDPLVCTCEEKCRNCVLKYGDVCDPDGIECCERRAECNPWTKTCECAKKCKYDCDCCVGAVCTSDGLCVCKKQQGDTCDPNSLVHQCCERDCVLGSSGVYECQ